MDEVFTRSDSLNYDEKKGRLKDILVYFHGLKVRKQKLLDQEKQKKMICGEMIFIVNKK